MWPTLAGRYSTQKKHMMYRSIAHDDLLRLAGRPVLIDGSIKRTTSTDKETSKWV